MRRFAPQSLAPISLALTLLAATAGGASAAELKTDEQKTFYAIGLAMSRSLGTFAPTAAELELIQQGLQDGVLAKEPRVDLNTYGPKIQELQKTRLAAAGEIEKKAGREFLAKAASEKGATKTASGLVITTLKAGNGASPKADDQVKVHYHGTLIDGTVFDSSVQRGEPATFPLNGVVPCWTEGVQLMKVGGKSRLTCPADLAYGDRGAPPRIKPGATLVFEVELLDIVK